MPRNTIFTCDRESGGGGWLLAATGTSWGKREEIKTHFYPRPDADQGIFNTADYLVKPDEDGREIDKIRVVLIDKLHEAVLQDVEVLQQTIMKRPQGDAHLQSVQDERIFIKVTLRDQNVKTQAVSLEPTLLWNTHFLPQLMDSQNVEHFIAVSENQANVSLNTRTLSPWEPQKVGPVRTKTDEPRLNKSRRRWWKNAALSRYSRWYNLLQGKLTK